MLKRFRNRKLSLLLGTLGILLLAILATGLDSLEFKKGEPFSYIREVVEDGSPPDMPYMGWIYYIVVGFYLLILFFVLYYSPREKRKKIIFALGASALVLLGLMWWISLSKTTNQAPEPVPTILHTAVPMSQVPNPGEEQVEPEVFLQPKISAWISIAVTFGVLLVIAFIVWLFLKSRLNTINSMEAIAGIAEKTVNELHSGKDYGDAVINCYADMMEVLNKRRSLFKRGDLTPMEFISVLERTTLPTASIRQLTALFEKARYGGKKTSLVDVEEAILCLNEIIRAIRD